MTAPRTAALVAVLALILGATACGGRDELIIYSGRGESLVRPLLERFAEDTGIDIAVRYAPSTEQALLLREEGTATDADVFLSQNPGPVALLHDDGRLTSLPDDLLEQVPPAFRGEEGSWVGLTARQKALAYNTDLVAPGDLPDSVFDLTADRYRGEVAIPPLNEFPDFVAAMILTEGEQRTARWLEDLAANGSPTYGSNNAIVAAVGRGEVPMGFVNHYYAFRFRAEDASLPVRNHIFSGGIGALVVPSAVSILETTDRPEEARRLVEYLLSEPAQRYFREETFEYPLRPGVEPVEGLVPLTDQDLPEVDYGQIGSRLQRAVELINASGLG